MAALTIAAFSDYHLMPENRNPWGVEGLHSIVKRAKDNHADVILQCGDFAMDSVHDREGMDAIYHNSAGIPAFGCYGNHELERVESLEALNQAFGLENSYYYADLKGFRIVCTDTNFYKKAGKLYHYGGYSWGTDSPEGYNLLGDEQLEWLEKTLTESPYPCIILGHVSFKSISMASGDAIKVREIINRVNARSHRKVMMCLNGHYHRDDISVLDNVIFFSINASYNGEWIPGEHDCFPEEFVKRYPYAVHNAYFTDPLSAIIHISDDGTVRIEGMQTSYLYDVSPEKFGGPIPTECGIGCSYISDANIKLV